MRTVKKMILLSSFAVLILASGTGCWKTFSSERVGNDCKFRGVPAVIYKPHLATVTWSNIDPKTQANFVSMHYCTLPVMYSVDVHPAPLGKTEATFKMAGDGQLIEAGAKLDHQIPELIKAIGEGAKTFVPTPAGRASAAAGFTPAIDSTNTAVSTFGVIINITFQDLDISKGCDSKCAK
jgi:hypothetical protein